MAVVDNESPPGSWKEEMDRAPWAFGQPRKISYTDAISVMRLRGMGHEADVIAAELYRLNDEIGRLKKDMAHTAATEREACAKLADEFYREGMDYDIGASIRARK